EQYTVYTDSNGVAKVTISGPSGSTIAYQVVATAPYLGSNSSAVSTQPAYVEFVVNNQAGIAPYAPDNSAPYNAAMGTPVPITVVLPPNASGQPQANVAVTLSVAYQSGGNGTNHASFVSSSGAVLGQQIQVVTNSSGVAQAYLSDTYGEEVKVTVSGLPVGVNQPNATYISFAQAGIAAKIANFNVSSNNPNIGDNVTVSGQLQDAAGNPVPNGQVIVTSPNVTASGGTGHLKYVNSDGTTTTFPMVSTSSVTAGTPATSAYGDVVTADSNGNFSFTVTDSRVETVNFYIYPVANGQIQSGTALNTANANQNTLNFGTSTNLAYLSIGAFDSYVASNSDTSLTGLTAQANAGGTAISTIGLDNGNNPQIADVYVEPQNSAGYHTGGALDNTALTYTLTVDNGGLIYSINGTRLSDHGLSPAAAVSLSYTPATATQPAKFSVNGVDWNLLTGAAHTSDFEVGVINANTGATKLTVQSGNVSSTASITFNGGTPDLVANFSPPYVTVSAGQSQKVTFQVQDANGNPVPNVATTILTDKDPSDPLWITQVNGVTLQETLNMGTDSNISYATEPTPIPLGTVPSALNYSVSVPGVVSWTKGSPNITVYSDSNGNVSLTLQAGGVNYPSAGSGSTPGNPNNVAAVPTSSGHVGFYSDENGDPGTIPLFIGVNPPTDGTTTNGSSFTAQGIFAWTGTGVVAAPDAASMSVTDNLSGTADTLDGAAGAVQAGATVKVYSDAALTTLVGSATAGANGSFSIPVGDNSSGTFTYYVTQTVGGVQSAATQVTYTAAQ
ncbi:MAG: hypothetical protein K6T81_20480, partial [Alicyclobacillus macrosporangiidus]|uniref:beta strand repeat-containing protein n=1 Tax=Alicyclobacillus macrosporangiidus TaxID=392015 RepID=UPI0026EC32D7